MKVGFYSLGVGVLFILYLASRGASLQGTWHLAHAIENTSDTLLLDSNAVTLIVDKDHYIFKSTLGNTESGTIDIDSKSLCLTPEEDHKAAYRIDCLLYTSPSPRDA